MSSTIFPVASTSSINSNAYTVANPLYQYKANTTLTPGIYTITSYPTSSVATVSGYDASNNFLSASTTGGTVTWNLTTTIANPMIYTNTGSNVIVTITLTAAPLTGSSVSGTLDTITTTSTYNQTGKLYVLAVGGGGDGTGYGAGGNGGNWQANTISNAGSPGTGYASGGGGAASGYYGGVSRAGGAGMPGVVYVLRGF